MSIKEAVRSSMALVWLTTLLLAVGAAQAQQLFEGSECYNDVAGRKGVCRPLTNCVWAENEVKNHRYPQICGWSNTLPVVCCPGGSDVTQRPTSRPTTWSTSRPTNRPTRPTSRPTNKPAVGQRGKIAKRMCAQYAQYVFKEDESYALSPLANGERINMCAAPGETLIVGGEEVNPREFPHMALIGYGDEGDIEYQCGGSLIAPDFIMTAAHCLITPGGRTARWVLLGELDRSTDREDAKPQRLEVREAIRHPNYHPPEHYNDIALLRMNRAADLNGYVRPACLYTEKAVTHSRGDPFATGWGHTEWAGDPSDRMMKVALPVQPYRVCNESYRSNVGRLLPRGILDDTQLCAGDLKGGKDTCQGDSGGPLQIFTTEEPYYCMHHIIGVTSFGKACGFRNSPAIYSRVSAYVPWIESVVWPNQ